jgi:hypothetical protein
MRDSVSRIELRRERFVWLIGVTRVLEKRRRIRND